jgi:hypothetical protein
MQKISAKIIVSNIDSQFVFRVYVPNRYLIQGFNNIEFTLFKNGFNLLTLTDSNVINRLETFSPLDYERSFLDFSISIKQARYLVNAASKDEGRNFESFLIITPSNSPGSVYRVSILESEKFLGAVPISESLLPKRAVSSQSELPSRSYRFTSGADDNLNKSFDTSRNKNLLCRYEKNLCISYAKTQNNNNSLRVIISNLPPGFSSVEVLGKKTNQLYFNEKSIRKIGEIENTAYSNWFYASDGSPGNFFTKSGGYIVFDYQIQIDLRNTIVDRNNAVSQNFFRNSRRSDGTLGESPITGLPIFPDCFANAGEVASFRVKLRGDIGIEKTFNIPLKVSSMSYSKSNVIFSCSPARIASAPSEATVMSTTPVNSSNRSIFIKNLDRSNLTDKDIVIDLNIPISSNSTTPPSPILEIFNSTNNADEGDTISSRTGGTYLVAEVERYDSLTGITTNLGFTSLNIFIDRISNPQIEYSVASLVAGDNEEFSARILDNFNRSVDRDGLTLIYNLNFYEITPEMLGAFLSADSVDDETVAVLFNNISNKRRNIENRDFFDFISDIIKSRRQLKTSTLVVNYATKERNDIDYSASCLYNQDNTNIPFYSVNGSITSGLKNISFFQIFRIERSLDLNSRIPARGGGVRRRFSQGFSSKEIDLGFIPVSEGNFSIKDFVPSSQPILSNGSVENTLDISYKLVPYGYLSENRLVLNKIQRLSRFSKIIRPRPRGRV